MKKKQTVLKSFGVRLDDAQMSLARDYGIDTGVLFREALAKKILEANGTCPTCQAVKPPVTVTEKDRRRAAKILRARQ